MKKIKNIAIVAFDNKKTDLIEWSYFNKEILMLHEIVALGFAAHTVEGTLNKKIRHIEQGNFGGYRQLKDLIIENKIDALIIFGEANEIFHTKYLNSVIEAAVENNIVVATNKTTADFLVHSSLMNNDYLISKKEKQTEHSATLNTAAVVSLAKAS